MFIDLEELDQLANYRNENNPVVSVYLNVMPPRNYTTELKSMLHTTRQNLADRMDGDRVKSVEKVFDRIETHVADALQRLDRTRLVVIFADNDGFWREYHLPVELPSQIVVEPDTYTRPLSILLDEFDRYCVLVCDTRKARLFSLFLGEFEEQPDIFLEDDVPDRVRVNRSRTMGAAAGVQGGLGDDNIQRHIEDHIHRHLKNVADRTFRYFKNKRFDRVIIGGPDNKVRYQLKEHLHSYLQKRLAGEFNARPEDDAEKLRKKAVEVAGQYEREQEHARINELFENSGPGGMAVLGADPVIEALTMGQVHTLVINHDFHKQGFVCTRDHMLSTHRQTCPLCGAQMESTADLGNEMVEEALCQNAEIEHVFAEHEEFGKYGVGARLRFTLGS